MDNNKRGWQNEKVGLCIALKITLMCEELC
jgi:hypothetical protein